MTILDRIKMALGIRSPSKEFPIPFIPESKELPQAELCGGSMERTSAPMTYKLGSLFDGSGGFPLAGSLCGIVPVWAAEVEPYPIAVTRSRFPNMRHLGDISKVNGAEIEPVDIITFGSPCQDLSIAGKRAGLKHADNGDEETTRSGLFMEAVRVIREMREVTNGIYPRFALWENVPGAFSSNKGEDFRTVLQELIQIVEPAAVMPAVPQRGWAYADSYCGDGWSLAYRVFDAQYWGVPQRRRRIHLVVDFTGQCAGNVLFEREGVRGYFETGRTPWQGIAAAAQDGPGAADNQGKGRGINGEIAATIDGSYYKGCGMRQGIEREVVAVPVSYTLKIRSGCEGGGKGALVQEDKSATLATNNDQYPTLSAAPSGTNQAPAVCIGFRTDNSAESRSIGSEVEKAPTVRPVHAPAVVYSNEKDPAGQTFTEACVGVMASSAKNAETTDGTISPCLMARAGTGGNQLPLVAITEREGCKQFTTRTDCEIRYIMRRLTPTECARLQGFADNHGHIEKKESMTPEELAFWTEVRNTHAAINGKAVKEYTEKQMLTWYNKLHTDSAEFKMWGNGIALPPALYCMQGIADALRNKK